MRSGDPRPGDTRPGDTRSGDAQASGARPSGTGRSGTGPSDTGPSDAQAQAADAIGSAPVAAGPGTVRRISLRDAPGVVPLARDFARQALHDWGWLPAQGADRRAAAEDVLLVVSELVTNACLHAEGPEDMTIGFGGKVLRVEVTDRGAGSPAPRTPHRAGRPGGHGMFIVQRLCLDWGVVRTPGVSGKTVWAELGAPG
ncbi:ATP-binding protein [Streptomyces uncialis]|uniref:ATP-binding protein n=1 Tax=Streptomyces uncialis TaxID=1048205 RepID=UPI0009A0ECB7|nr:ATP-binding protein [Streptomyces uncialis]